MTENYCLINQKHIKQKVLVKSERVIAAIIRKSVYYFPEIIQLLCSQPKTWQFSQNMKEGGIHKERNDEDAVQRCDGYGFYL